MYTSCAMMSLPALALTACTHKLFNMWHAASPTPDTMRCCVCLELVEWQLRHPARLLWSSSQAKQAYACTCCALDIYMVRAGAPVQLRALHHCGISVMRPCCPHLQTLIAVAIPSLPAALRPLPQVGRAAACASQKSVFLGVGTTMFPQEPVLVTVLVDSVQLGASISTKLTYKKRSALLVSTVLARQAFGKWRWRQLPSGESQIMLLLQVGDGEGMERNAMGHSAKGQDSNPREHWYAACMSVHAGTGPFTVSSGGGLYLHNTTLASSLVALTSTIVGSLRLMPLRTESVAAVLKCKSGVKIQSPNQCVLNVRCLAWVRSSQRPSVS